MPFLLGWALKKNRDKFAWANKLTDKKEGFYKINFFWKKERKLSGLGGYVISWKRLTDV